MTREELEAVPHDGWVRDDRGQAWKHCGRLWLAGNTGMSTTALLRRGPITRIEVRL